MTIRSYKLLIKCNVYGIHNVKIKHSPSPTSAIFKIVLYSISYFTYFLYGELHF